MHVLVVKLLQSLQYVALKEAYLACQRIQLVESHLTNIVLLIEVDLWR